MAGATVGGRRRSSWSCLATVGRQGPLTGPGLITSQKYIDIPDTEPGEIAEISAPLKAPGYDCSSIAYFKMVDDRGLLCFPDAHQLGLDVLARVERNTGGVQD